MQTVKTQPPLHIVDFHFLPEKQLQINDTCSHICFKVIILFLEVVLIVCSAATKWSDNSEM